MKKTLSHRSLALVCAATFLPAAMAVGTLSGGLFKLVNPDNIDVWQPLAYLSNAIIPGVVVGAILLAVAVVIALQLSRQEGTWRRSAKLPLVIMLTNLVLIGLIFGGQAITRTAEDNWAWANGQQTHEQRDRQLDDFFRHSNTKQ